MRCGGAWALMVGMDIGECCRLVGVELKTGAAARANTVVSEVAVIPRGHPPLVTCFSGGKKAEIRD